MKKTFHSIVIGAGHNGLVCAAYLAKAGHTVLVLEANSFLGGCASTQEFYPGFHTSRAAHLLHGLSASVVSDLQLQQHGLTFSAQKMRTVALSTQQAALHIDANTVVNLPAQYRDDQQRYEQFVNQMDRFASVLQLLNEQIPSRVIPGSWSERWQLLKVGIRLRLLGREDMREFLRIAGMNVYDLLEEKFRCPELKGALAMDATLGAEHGPRSPGTVLNYLQRWAARRSAGNIGTVQIKSGAGALCSAIAKSAQQAGCEIRLDARVKQVLVQNDRAVGVELDNGEQLFARNILSNADPKTSYLKLVGHRHLDTGFVRRLDHHRCKGLTAKLHLALKQAPVFSNLSRADLQQRLLIAPSLDYVELAFNPSKYGEWPTAPVVEISIPTFSDTTLAPKDQHVLSAIVQFVPLHLHHADKAPREQFIAQLLSMLETLAPGLRESVLHAELLLPQDIADQFNVHGGHWHHGALAFDQFYFLRPVPGASRYEGPLPGFFLCGAGAHPGGGVMGTAGQLAAQAVLAQTQSSQANPVEVGAPV